MLAAPECKEFQVAIQAQNPRDVWHWVGMATDEEEAEFIATTHYEDETGRIDYWIVSTCLTDEL